MKLTANEAANIYKRSEVNSASLIETKIATASVGNGKMPKRHLFSSCNSTAARDLRGNGFKVLRIGPYALVRW